MIQKKLWIPAAVAGALAVVYLGLCAYADKQAEKRLDEYVSAYHLAGKLTWTSISSSPLTGKVVLGGVDMRDGKVFALHADRVAVSDVINTDARSRWRVNAEGVVLGESLLRSIGAMGLSGGIASRVFGSDGYSPLLGSGRRELKPFELTLFLDINDDARDLRTETTLAIPELFTFSFGYRVSQLANMHRALNDIRQTPGFPEVLPPGAVQTLQSVFAEGRLSEFKVSFKDSGLVRRSVLLDQRYNTPLDPTAGSADQQRKTVFEQRMVHMQKDCESTTHQFAPMLDDGCELMVKLFKGKNDGIQLSIDPKDPVRLVDLMGLRDGANGRRLLEKLNPEVSSL